MVIVPTLGVEPRALDRQSGSDMIAVLEADTSVRTSGS